MLAANLSQKLDDNLGILGFLEEDLAKEAKRASKLVRNKWKWLVYNENVSNFVCFFNYRPVFIANFEVQALVAVSVAVENHFICLVQ